MRACRSLVLALCLLGPFAAQAQPGRLGIGDVRVTIGPPPLPGRHQIFEATAVSRIPRDALERALRDPKGWAVALPSFKAIEPLGTTVQVQRARLAFAGVETPIVVTVKLAGRMTNAQTDWTSVLWSPEEELKAPVYMRGEWYLAANADGGTRVRLTIVIDPRHWPGSERLFSSERMANALLDLERAAMKP